MTARDSEVLPTVTAAPGMTMNEVIAASTAALDSAEVGGRLIAQPEGPHRVRIRDPRRGFELPASLFSVLEVSGPIVVRILTSPHPKALDWGAALDRVNGIGATLEAAGWTAHERLAPQDLAKRLQIADEDRVGVWRNLSWTSELRIRRAVRGGTRLAEVLEFPADTFLVTLTLWDERLAGFPEGKS